MKLELQEQEAGWIWLVGHGLQTPALESHKDAEAQSWPAVLLSPCPAPERLPGDRSCSAVAPTPARGKDVGRVGGGSSRSVTARVGRGA